MIRQIPALEPNEGQRAQMARRFGMFIHFGVSIPSEMCNGRTAAYRPDRLNPKPLMPRVG